jgi:hypothetical protein
MSAGRVVAMAQALVRVYPFSTVVAWCPGGPVGSLESCTRETMVSFARSLGARMLYCRTIFLRPQAAADVRFLESNGWKRPRAPLSARSTAILDLRQSGDELLKGLNRNWRYSLRQAQKTEVPVERLTPVPIAEMASLIAEMRSAKQLDTTMRSADLVALFDAFGDQAIVYGCRNATGGLIAFHSCVLYGGRAWELVAATSDEGRSNGASFSTLWALLMHCRERGATQYDLAGIDAVKAPGVADFKRWTGADEVEWLGEWQWSTIPLIGHAVDFAVQRRPEAALP